MGIYQEEKWRYIQGRNQSILGSTKQCSRLIPICRAERFSRVQQESQRPPLPWISWPVGRKAVPLQRIYSIRCLTRRTLRSPLRLDRTPPPIARIKRRTVCPLFDLNTRAEIGSQTP